MALRPKINTTISENISLIAPSGAQTIAIIGTAQWGDVNVVKNITTLNDALAIFGSDKANLTLIKAIDLATRNGASSIKAVRIVDGDEAKASLALDGNSTAEADVLTFVAKYYGSYGNSISVTVSANATNASNRDIVITDGVSREVFNNSQAGYSTNSSIKTAIEAGSNLIGLVTVKSGSESSNLVDATSGAEFLTTGDDGHDTISDADVTTALSNVLYSEDFTILVAPRLEADHASVSANDTYFETLETALTTRANSEQKYAVVFGGVTQDETIAEMVTRTSAGSRLTLVTPGIKYTPSYQTTEIVLNGTFTACAYAGMVSALSIGQSPTHKSVAISPVINEAADTLYYNKLDQETILNQRIVPITREAGSIIAIRGVTRDSDTTSIYFEQNIVLMTDYIRTQLEEFYSGFIGDLNSDRNRKMLASETDARLAQFKRDEIIADYQATEVTAGISLDTVNIAVAIQPLFAINFINLNMSISKVD